MSENTAIEWTDSTFNPWEGCQKVGPGCDHCYAETRNARFGSGVAVNWGPGAPRRRTSVSNWNLPKKWNAAADAFMAAHGRRQRVFCSSLADVFDNAVPIEWLVDLLGVIRATPNLDWLLLTKRVGIVMSRLAQARDHALQIGDIELAAWLYDWLTDRKPPTNVWLGATIVNQEEADRDIPKLLRVPARVRFLSMEPLLEPVDLGLCDCDNGSRPGPGGAGGVACVRCGGVGGRMVDWVIVGGESGPGARPMHPDWARSLRDQCQEAGVPFLFKQWGEWGPMEDYEPFPGDALMATAKTFIDIDRNGFRRNGPSVIRRGKKANGRMLDGRTWDGVPA